MKAEGDKVYGVYGRPGIYDMKGGAHNAFIAYKTIAEAGKKTPLPIRILYLSDEEVGSPTSEDIIVAASDTAKYVLVTEPARFGGKIVTARKGTARYLAKTHGRPSHSGGAHERGRSAIREMARLILEVEGWTDYERGITTNVGMISGGTAINVVPEHCTAEIDLRVKTVADADEMHARFMALASSDRDVALEVSGGPQPAAIRKDAGDRGSAGTCKRPCRRNRVGARGHLHRRRQRRQLHGPQGADA